MALREVHAAGSIAAVGIDTAAPALVLGQLTLHLLRRILRLKHGRYKKRTAEHIFVAHVPSVAVVDKVHEQRTHEGPAIVRHLP